MNDFLRTRTAIAGVFAVLSQEDKKIVTLMSHGGATQPTSEQHRAATTKQRPQQQQPTTHMPSGFDPRVATLPLLDRSKPPT